MQAPVRADTWVRVETALVPVVEPAAAVAMGEVVQLAVVQPGLLSHRRHHHLSVVAELAQVVHGVRLLWLAREWWCTMVAHSVNYGQTAHTLVTL